jgi:HEAT repeat protein
VLTNDKLEQEAFSWQMSQLAALEPVLTEYLEEAPRHLCLALQRASGDRERDLLPALADLRAETAPTVLPLLANGQLRHSELAVQTLRWSHDPEVAPRLMTWASTRMRRTRRRLATTSPRHASVPFLAILQALRGHASQETESFLLAASKDWDPTCRAAAISSLGWWEPFNSNQVSQTLQEARHDRNPEVRQAARAALARLGERFSLQWFRQSLLGPDTRRAHEAIEAIANEGLVLLWPDLDRLADTENTDVSLHACEALEQLREELSFRTA